MVVYYAIFLSQYQILHSSGGPGAVIGVETGAGLKNTGRLCVVGQWSFTGGFSSHRESLFLAAPQ